MPRSTRTLALCAVLTLALVGPDALAGGFAPQLAQATGSPQAPAAAPETPLAELLARARALSASGKFLDAYHLLAGAEDTYIGLIEFDYALGRAALDAGYPAKATLAFSRVLALDPNHAGALIDTGRAYLALGNVAQAQVIFERLLALNPPPAVRTQLQAFLDQARLERARGMARAGLPHPPGVPSLRGYVAALVGRSTNVNQSPAQSQVFVPALDTSLVLAEQNVKKADNFTGILGGADASMPMNGTFSVIGGGDIIERNNARQSQFDIAGVGGRLGVAAAGQRQLLRVQVQVARDYLGDSPSYDLNAVTADYLWAPRGDTQLLAFGQGGRLRYVPADLKIFNTDFVALGLGAIRKIGEKSTVFVVVPTGRQDDVGGNVSGDKRSLGLRMGADVYIWPRLTLQAGAAWERGQYNALDPSFLVERRDKLSNYEAVLDYRLEPNKSLRLGVTRANQQSNIPIYEYDRTEGWIMFRVDLP